MMERGPPVESMAPDPQLVDNFRLSGDVESHESKQVEN